MCVSTRISKSPVLVRALPVSERVPVLVRAYARFSVRVLLSRRGFLVASPGLIQQTTLAKIK